VEPVQPKQRKYTRRSKPTKKNDKEFVESWTIEEERALCKAFVAKSEDSVQGNDKKAAGFWREVAERFHNKWAKTKEATILLTANGKIGFVLRLVNFVRFIIVYEIGTKVGHVIILSIKKPSSSIVLFNWQSFIYGVVFEEKNKERWNLDY
ncbi:hypothetical protein Tco_0112894, partial [Tanacetum coccineum]